MDIAVVGTSAPIDPIWQKLNDDLGFLRQAGWLIEVEKVPLRDYTIMRFAVDEADGERLPADLRLLSKQYIASTLADIVVDQLEERIVWHIIKQEYTYLAADEQTKIYTIASRLLSHDKKETRVVKGSTGKTIRRNRILYRLLEYFEDNDTIILEGFINFRLRSYLDELQGTVDQAALELLLQNEQQELVTLLQYFVEMQNSREDLVHVVFKPQDGFDLQDEKHHSIQDKYIDDMLLSLVGSTISMDDLLISSLITISPMKIIIHAVNGENRREVVRTVVAVFENRVEQCSTCQLCTTDKR